MVSLSDKTKIKNRIRALLAYDEKFRRYQELPAFLLRELDLDPRDYASDQLAWDAPRYDWIAANLSADTARVTELGSSLGYFCLRLVHEHGLAAVGYEPVEAYAEVCNLFAELTGLDDRLRFSAEPAVLDYITDLAAADLVISLNVMHHAGNVFDRDVVKRHGGWRNYAREYLARLTRVAPHLILQTGNSVHGAALFPGKDAVPFMTALLEEAGWRVDTIGVIERFDRPTYRQYPRAAIDDIPRIQCSRNPDTGLVEYRIGSDLVATLPYGTLQRPLFACTRMD